MNIVVMLICINAFGFVHVAHTRVPHHDSYLDKQLSACNLPNICGANGACEITEKGIECKFQEGFRGKRCEHFACKRCGLYSTQYESMKKCAEGQMCVPDNFYCHFNRCKHAQGWCIPWH